MLLIPRINARLFLELTKKIINKELTKKVDIVLVCFQIY